MNRAEQVKLALVSGSMSFDELMEEACEVADNYENDYENELSWFEYADGSVVMFNGVSRELIVYGCK